MMKFLRRKRAGSELVARYKRNYSIAQEAHVTEEMILAHWELEKSLTRKLMGSDPDRRWRIFDECYSTLYRELPWLNALVEQSRAKPADELHIDWRSQLEPPPKKVYEIGAGRGELILYLAEHGFTCRAAEITLERGEGAANSSHDALSWGVSDGVHLSRFEPPGTYDAVLSDQVLEHLHPDDLLDHMQGAYDLLRTGGSYLLRTPHRFTGPHDISRVFGHSRACGMHLKEYTFRELVDRLKIVGFTRIGYVMPERVRLILQSMGIKSTVHCEKIARVYLAVLLSTERLLSMIPVQTVRVRAARIFGKGALFRDSIFLAAMKT